MSPSQASPTCVGLAPTRSLGLRLLQPPGGARGSPRAPGLEQQHCPVLWLGMPASPQGPPVPRLGEGPCRAKGQCTGDTRPPHLEASLSPAQPLTGIHGSITQAVPTPPGLSSLGKADGLHPGMGSSLPGLAKERGEFGDTQPRGAQLLWHCGSVLAPGGCVRHIMSNAVSPPASPKGRTQITHCIAKEGCSSQNRSGMEQEPCGGKAPCIPSAVPPCPGPHQRRHRPSKLSDGWGPFVAHAGS